MIKVDALELYQAPFISHPVGGAKDEVHHNHWGDIVYSFLYSDGPNFRSCITFQT